MPGILAKLEAGENLSAAEVSAYTMFMRGRITEAWQVFYQRQNGMIEKRVADALLDRFEVFTGSGLFRGVWIHKLEVGFPVEFQEYVESLIGTANQHDGGAA